MSEYCEECFGACTMPSECEGMAQKRGLLPGMREPYLDWLKREHPELYKMIIDKRDEWSEYDVLSYKGKYYYRETLIQNVANINWEFVKIIMKWRGE